MLCEAGALKRASRSLAQRYVTLLAAGAISAPLSASASDVRVVSSPYRFAASEAFAPVWRDANWDQELCVMAYHYEYRLDDLPKLIADRIAQFDADSAERRARGDSDAEIASQRSEFIESWADDVREFREEAAAHIRNIPKCKGLFFRPALEVHCDEYERARNRFCAILEGKDMDGVRLTSETTSFRSGLASSFVGAIVDRGDVAVF